MSADRAPTAGTPARIQAVLFDLDGTLIDSAPDLGAAANRMRLARGLAELPLAAYRRWAGAGARGMLGVAFGIKPTAACWAALREEFFREYETELCVRTAFFDAVPALLLALRARGLPWGVVTNKSERLTLPLLAQIPEFAHAAAVVCGDTTPFAKPHPEPVLEACRRLKLAPQQALYVGDDERDIRAGACVGTQTAACTWGYLGANAEAVSWQADHLLHTPEQILAVV